METNLKYVPGANGKKWKTTTAGDGSIAVRMKHPKLEPVRHVVIDGHSVEACESAGFEFMDPYTEPKAKEK